MRQSSLLSLVCLLIILALLPTTSPTRHVQAADERCFAETEYCISGRIRAFWEQNGGLEVFGLPITPQQEQVVEGQPLQVQWFERHRLELHPQQAPPYDVLMGRLGVLRLEQQGRDWHDFPKDEGPREGCRFFAETQQNVCGDILAAWQANGLEFDGESGISTAESLALYGFPLSGEIEEQVLVDGRYQQYTVQWFERTRFELHPQQEPPFHVQRGLLGVETWQPDQAIAQPAPTPETHPLSADSTPHALTRVQDRLFFIANDGIHGRELWRTDGTTEGTKLVKDILPGRESSSPAELTSFKGMLFFTAETGRDEASVLWRSDGTAAGTVPIKDVLEHDQGMGPWQLTVVGDTLYFVADDGIHGPELWKSDGTPDGTVMVTEIVAGAAGMYPKDAMPMGYIPYGLTAVDGTLFFHADDGVHGDELWKSDGTPDGTVLVHDVNAGATPTEYYELTPVDGVLFFIARTGRLTYELWRSDGTTDGTTMVKSFTKHLPPGVSPPLRNYPHIGGLTALNGVLFFSAGGEDTAGFWRSDGTPAGTVKLHDDFPCCLTAGEQAVFFLQPDGAGTKAGLWRSDASLQTVQRIAEVPADANRLIATNGLLFFLANHTDFRARELWVSDGTAANTRLVKSLPAGWSNSSEPGLMAALDERTLLLSGDDGVHGLELWRSDGTAEGTVMVKDMNETAP